MPRKWSKRASVEPVAAAPEAEPTVDGSGEPFANWPIVDGIPARLNSIPPPEPSIDAVVWKVAGLAWDGKGGVLDIVTGEPLPHLSAPVRTLPDWIPPKLAAVVERLGWSEVDGVVKVPARSVESVYSQLATYCPSSIEVRMMGDHCTLRRRR